jgi:hypothetical protein
MSLFSPLVAPPLIRYREWECIACKETAPSITGARYFICATCIDKADDFRAELREVGLR